MFRYRNLLLTLIVVLSIVLAACAPAAPAATEPPPTEKPATAPATQAAATEVAPTENVQATKAPAFAPGTTLTYIASQNWIKDTEMELAKKFEAETGVHIDFQIIPSDQYFNVLQTKLEAG